MCVPGLRRLLQRVVRAEHWVRLAGCLTSNIAWVLLALAAFCPAQVVSGASPLTLPPISNPNTIVLPGGDPLDPGPGSIYPSTVQVNGLTNGIVKVTVTVRNIAHPWPDDIDLLLVGPQGQTVMLMSDCGLDNPASDVTITFDDDAAQFVPGGDPGISSGTFKPTNDGTLDDFLAPAPQRPYGTALSVFQNTNPNGTWALYAFDDQPEQAGFIADGWTLTLTIGDPIADLVLTQSAPTTPVMVGNNLAYTITVTNRGPAHSSALVTDVLPSSMSFVSVTTTRGACTNAAGTVTCNLGNLLVNQGARIELTVSPNSGATTTNTVTVAGNQLELSPTNNSASVVTSSIGISDLAVNIVGTPAPALLGQPMLYHVVVTNHGPNQAGGVNLTNVLPAGFTMLAAVPSQGACSVQAASFSCSLGVVPAGASSVVQVTARPNVLGVHPCAASVTTSGLDLASSNNVASVDITVDPAADLGISALAGVTNILQGQNLVSVFSVSSQGPSSTAAQFSNPLPPGFTFVSSSTTRGGCTNTGASIECNLGTMVNGDSAQVSVVLRAVAAGTLTNLAQVSGSLSDPVPANNLSGTVANVTPSVDVAVSMTDSPDPVWLGDNVLYRMAITNRGLGEASSVALTNIFPPGFEFVSATPDAGACAQAANEISCALGPLAPGAGMTVNVILRPPALGLYTSVVSVATPEIDPTPQNNATVQVTRVITDSGTFGTAAPISITEFGSAFPYPSTVLVSGMTSAVFHLRVSVTNLSHTYPDDLDLLLVGPQGQTALLMSDAGGETDLNNVTLTFDDGASGFLPDSSPIISGAYRPSNYESNPDSLPAPAPSGLYPTNLAGFRNTDPNGTWSLYVVDDAVKDAGIIAGGWGITFFAQDPMADLAVAQTPSVNPAPIAANMSITYVVTNRGPTIATEVHLTNGIPAGLQGVTFQTTQGSCGNFGGVWICNLGSIASGGSARVTVNAIPAVMGQIPNTVTVGGPEIDARSSDNNSILILVVEQPPTILTNPSNVTVTNGASAQFSASAGGTGPLRYQWQRDGVNLPGATNTTLNIASVAPSNSGTYRVVVTNRVGLAISQGAALVVQGPPFISDLPNRTINENTSTGTVPFILTDAESPADSLTLLKSSSNAALVPEENILLGGSGTNRNLSVTPLSNQSGVTTISIVATDPDGNSTTNQFILTVNQVIDPPRFVSITQVGTVVTLSFTTESGFTYTVEYKDTLDDTIWTPVESLSGNGGTVVVTDSLAVTPTRFYRVRAN